MRYIALIAAIDFLLVAATVMLTGGNFSFAVFLAGIICVIAIPLCVIVGIPMLWLSRRLAPGSVIPLAILGALAGTVCPVIVNWGFQAPELIALGTLTGLVSAVLWWALVERDPERRAYYD